jgi:hypothetical protein
MLKAPDLTTYNINLIGCMYTLRLGVFFLKKNPKGGSVVLNASVASTLQSAHSCSSIKADLHQASRGSASWITVSLYFPLPLSQQYNSNPPRRLQTRRPRPPPQHNCPPHP